MRLPYDLAGVSSSAMRRELARWARAGLVAAFFFGLAIAGLWHVTSPILDEVFRDVANDHCRRFASGEPDRGDPDCHSNWGTNNVEEWDRAHPEP